MPRKSLPADIEAQVLHLSRRRCCLCFGLLGDFGLKKGQIAHLDHDPANNALDNLAFLCLEHHDEYDSTTSQSKGLKIREILAHRDALYSAVRRFLDAAPAAQEESPLAATGELDYYLSATASSRAAGLLVLERIHTVNTNLLAGLNSANDAARAELARGQASLAGQKRYHSRLASALTDFARDLTRGGEELTVATAQMLDASSRAAAVASDIEFAESQMFLRKIQELDQYRAVLKTTGQRAADNSGAVRALGRGSTNLNRARRLAIAAFQDFAKRVEQQLAEIERHEGFLRDSMDLL